MKQITLFAVCALFCATACNPIGNTGSGQETGSLVVSVKSGDEMSTKSNTDPTGKEAAIHDVQVFLFTQDGSLYRRETFGENVVSQTVENIKPGYYTVIAVANGPDLSSVKKRQDLEQARVTLGQNDPTKGFMMYGIDPNMVMVTSDTSHPASSALVVRRQVSRIRLTTVQNLLPSDFGALTVKSVFLANGLGAWNCSASGDPTEYVNYAGRKKGKSASTNQNDYIVSVADAEYSALTFKDVNQSVTRSETPVSINVPLYTLPNKLAAASDHFDGATSDGACTRLVLLVTYGTGNEPWYYPVTIPSLARNMSYDVSFTITGPGSKDPNQKVTNGNMNVDITIDPWGNGSEITGDF